MLWAPPIGHKLVGFGSSKALSDLCDICATPEAVGDWPITEVDLTPVLSAMCGTVQFETPRSFQLIGPLLFRSHAVGHAN